MQEEFTNIRVDPQGNWYTADKKIINEEVLHFFRSNLFRDEKGIYIFNQFRGFKEKGYIKVEGPVMMVEQVIESDFILSDGSRLSAKDSELVIDSQGIPYVKIDRLGAWAGFPARSAHTLQENLQEKEDGFFWYGRKVTVYETIPWVCHEYRLS